MPRSRTKHHSLSTRLPLALTLGFALLSTPAPAAPLEETTDPASQQERNAPVNFAVTPAARPSAGQSLADRDGNGLSDGLEALMESRGPEDPVNVIVTLSGPGNSASAQSAVGSFAVYREFSLISGFAATMTVNQAHALAGTTGIARVESDATAYATLEAARRDFGVDALRSNVTDLTSQSPTGASVKVCILDTGIQDTHEQFTYDNNGTPVSRVADFVDLVGDYDGVIRTDAYDDNSHGTHVAGIIGGDGIVGTGDGADPVVAPLAQGVAPAVSLFVAKVLDYNGSGPDSGIIDGLQWCVNKKADVVNLSLAIPGSSDGQDAFSQAVNAAVNDHGLVVVAAAGNSGDGEKTIGSPAAAEKAITVGAVAEHSEGTLIDATSLGVYPPPFSSHGPTADGRIKPDIAAPGVSILSAITNIVYIDPDPLFGGGGRVDLGCGVGCYTIKSGTSMAAPFAAGAVALILEANPGLTPDQVREFLVATAQERGPAGKDNVFGHGLIDVAAAVSAAESAGQPAGASPPATVFPNNVFLRSSVADNGVVHLPIVVADMTKPLAITITIDGRMTRFGWSPDIDVWLLDASGKPFLVPNPFYPAWSDVEFFSAPGTSSTCPAGEDCGPIGTQETIHIGPGSPLFNTYWADLWQEPGKFILELRPFDGRPNKGKGGSFSVELSNAYFDGPLAADAGPDATATADDITGMAEVTLDGRSTKGHVTSYEWRDAVSGMVIATGPVTKVSLPVDAHTIELHVQNDTTSNMDEVVVTVMSAGDGGGGGGKKGGGDGGGKPCNSKKETCP